MLAGLCKRFTERKDSMAVKNVLKRLDDLVKLQAKKIIPPQLNTKINKNNTPFKIPPKRGV